MLAALIRLFTSFHQLRLGPGGSPTSNTFLADVTEQRPDLGDRCRRPGSDHRQAYPPAHPWDRR